MKRLLDSEKDLDKSTVRDRSARHRQIAEPVILMEEENEAEEPVTNEAKEESEEEDEIDEAEREARRLELKKKALQRQEVAKIFIL